MSVVALVPAAGSGQRLGADVPKAFVTVGGRALLVHAVDRLLAAGVDRVVVAVPADHRSRAGNCWARGRCVVIGGADRVASVSAALGVAGDDAEVILVHDAARSFAPESMIQRVIDAVRGGAAAVVPVLPVTDTVRSLHPDGSVAGTVDREMLRIVQTPQGFSPAVLRRAHAGAGGPGRHHRRCRTGRGVGYPGDHRPRRPVRLQDHHCGGPGRCAAAHVGRRGRPISGWARDRRAPDRIRTAVLGGRPRVPRSRRLLGSLRR